MAEAAVALLVLWKAYHVPCQFRHAFLPVFFTGKPGRIIAGEEVNEMTLPLLSVSLGAMIMLPR